jgi:hypothetical protein
MENFSSAGHKSESEDNPEITALVSQLETQATELGQDLADTDFLPIGADDAMKLRGFLEMVLSAVAIASGLAISYEAGQSLLQSHAGPDNLEAIRLAQNLGVAAIAGSGFTIFFKAVQKLEVGYKRLLGYIQMKELKELGK